MPLMVSALMRRQRQALAAQETRRQNEVREKELERVAFLGQMAAGVAHELNNALAVIHRGSEWIGNEVAALMQREPDAQTNLFNEGFEHGRPLHPGSNRERVQALKKMKGMSFSQAQKLARLPFSIEQLQRLCAKGDSVDDIIHAWELGATLNDMVKASRQAHHVVTSMKQLGASERLRNETVSLQESLQVALAILERPLRSVAVSVQLDAVASLHANQGELVQIWSNLIKNACDAMAQQSDAQIWITSSFTEVALAITIRDNGPGIPEDIRDQIFQPSTTTKKDGLSFGLGLGLSIVESLVTVYGGTIRVSSDSGTAFTVSFPKDILL